MLMKAKGLLILLVTSVGLVQAQAQYVIVASGYGAPPVTVQAPVVAAAPVVCPGPAACGAPLPCPVPVACAPAGYPYAGYTPNVVYFGGPYSCLRNYYNGKAVYGYPYSQVVIFGRGEAWQRGYCFNGWR